MKREIPRYLETPDAPLLLDDPETSRFARRHVFSAKEVEAVNTALAAGRPLLVRGEPGAGKSQLALAAAVGLGRALVATVVEARTEARDLLWRFDAVRRLADAQVLGKERLAGREAGEDPLAEENYLEPGPLWWAFAWQRAARQAGKAQVAAPAMPQGGDWRNGVVVLLDEIDKADSSVPNGLLGALGDGRFAIPGCETVERGGIEPLVILTTNEERALPDAFLRRCVVLKLRLPTDKQGLLEWLLVRGRAHFGSYLDEEVMSEAAAKLWQDRQYYLQRSLAPPGGAEYLDLLRVLAERGETAKEQLKLLTVVRELLLRKHPDEGHR
ncbi:MAG: MoxR family ATPase [Holophagales bacterium]|nr:MoxR family ATPase [Holophagales bacterium]